MTDKHRISTLSHSLALAACISCASLGTVDAAGPPVAFNITINYTGDPSFQAAFDQAETTWESLIPSYIDGHQGLALFNGIVITASVAPIDGVGNTLGSAGPLLSGLAVDDSGFVLATTGVMTFDSADFTAPTPLFQEVILHEMGHVLGIGTLWDFNGLYDPNAAAVIDPNNGQTVGQYTGAQGLLGWQLEYDNGATYVPVEKGGGTGTANGHWNEGDGGGATGYVSNITGNDMNLELMTGWANPNSQISNLTRGSLRDLGYNVALTVTAVPEPSGLLLSTMGLFGLILRRKR